MILPPSIAHLLRNQAAYSRRLRLSIRFHWDRLADLLYVASMAVNRCTCPQLHLRWMHSTNLLLIKLLIMSYLFAQDWSKDTWKQCVHIATYAMIADALHTRLEALPLHCRSIRTVWWWLYRYFSLQQQGSKRTQLQIFWSRVRSRHLYEMLCMFLMFLNY